MIWTKQPIKNEITALAAQGNALNNAVTTLNSKIVSPLVTTIGSYSDLQTAISTIAANMPANSFENMSISLSAAFTEFPNGGNYGVRIHKEQDNNHISALIQGYNNEVKFLRYKNGTWSIDDFALNSDIATHNFGTNTVANHQTAIVAYAATLEDLTVKNISFLVNENAGEFSQTRYVGQLIKTNNNRINVEVRQGLNDIRPIIGKYTNGTWEWNKLVLNSNLTPTLVSLTAEDGVSIQDGGVYKLGRLVIVQLRLQLASAKSGVFVRGLPIPIGANYNTVTTANNKTADIGVTIAGNIQTSSTIDAGVLLLSTCYISAN